MGRTAAFLLAFLSPLQAQDESEVARLPGVFPLEQLTGTGLVKQRRIATAVLVEDPVAEVDWVLTVLPTAQPQDVFQIEVNRTQILGKLKAFGYASHLTLLEIPALDGVPKVKFVPPPGELLAASAVSVFPGSTAQGQPPVDGKLAFREIADPGLPRMWRLQAPLVDGCFGAPVQLTGGALLGLLWQHVEPENPLGFRIFPARHLQVFLQDMVAYGEPIERWLGIIFQQNSLVPVVVGVRADSPAAEAGLEHGDILLSVAGQPVQDLQDLVDIRSQLPLDLPAPVRFLRGTDEKKCQLTPRKNVRKSQ